MSAASVTALLGAQRQAASSMALAYPERRFAFLADQAALDGWDLPNVAIRFAEPGGAIGPESGPAVALCPRWLAAREREAWRLSASFKRLADAGFEHLLPVRPAPGPQGLWQVKGDVFHRPDAPKWGAAEALADIDDPHGCGLVYQQRLTTIAHALVMGRRLGDAVSLGVMRIHAERFFRDDVIQAAQTVEHPFLVEQSLLAVEALGCQGFFTLNWLETPGGWHLSSFRPVPRAGFAMLRRQGADLLSVDNGLAVARPGGCFVAHPHYASYVRLQP